MHDREVFAVPKGTRDAAVGKIIAIVLIGTIVGYAVAWSLARDYERGQALTLEKYVADYQKYRDDLLDTVPLWASITLGIIFSGAVFGVYEVIGRSLGALLGRVLR